MTASINNPEVKLVRTDIKGNNYYEFINVEVLPYMRFEAYHVALAAAERRINDELLLKRIEQITSCVEEIIKDNKNTTAKKEFYNIIDDITVRMSLACERNTCLSLAKTFILIENEPLSPTVSEMENWNKVKEIAWSLDEDTLFFCAARGANQITNLKNIAISELVQYLKTQLYENL
jgi:hypothetical protein